jgi:hypothetical protein
VCGLHPRLHILRDPLSLQHKGGFFKVAMPDRWMVIATGRMAEEMRCLPDDAMSFLQFINEVGFALPNLSLAS